MQGVNMMKNNRCCASLKRKYYVRGEVVDIEEDQTHEFKGHRNISFEEVPPWCVNTTGIRTRNAISRYWRNEITPYSAPQCMFT